MTHLYGRSAARTAAFASVAALLLATPTHADSITLNSTGVAES